jgi:hypothetical protein
MGELGLFVNHIGGQKISSPVVIGNDLKRAMSSGAWFSQLEPDGARHSRWH